MTEDYEYGIYPMGNIKEPYCWKFARESEAKKAAFFLSEKNNTDVVVFRIIGTYLSTAQWKELPKKEIIPNTITVTPPAIHFCKYCKHRLPDKDETAFCRMGQVDYVNSCRGLARCYEKNRDGLCKDFKAKA